MITTRIAMALGLRGENAHYIKNIGIEDARVGDILRGAYPSLGEAKILGLRLSFDPGFFFLPPPEPWQWTSLNIHHTPGPSDLCRYCGGESTLACDAPLPGGMTCDHPFCAGCSPLPEAGEFHLCKDCYRNGAK